MEWIRKLKIDFEEYIHTTKDGRIMEVEVMIFE